MDFSSNTLTQARDQGYSDEDIYSHLGEADPTFAKAKEAGFSLDQVAGHFDDQIKAKALEGYNQTMQALQYSPGGYLMRAAIGGYDQAKEQAAAQVTAQAGNLGQTNQQTQEPKVEIAPGITATGPEGTGKAQDLQARYEATVPAIIRNVGHDQTPEQKEEAINQTLESQQLKSHPQWLQGLNDVQNGLVDFAGESTAGGLRLLGKFSDLGGYHQDGDFLRENADALSGVVKGNAQDFAQQMGQSQYQTFNQIMNGFGKVGGFIATATASGGSALVPLAVSAIGAYNSEYADKKEELSKRGDLSPEQVESGAQQSGSLGALKDAAINAVFMGQGHLIGEAAGKVFSQASPLVKGLTTAIAASVGNLATQQAIKGAEAGAKEFQQTGSLTGAAAKGLEAAGTSSIAELAQPVAFGIMSGLGARKQAITEMDHVKAVSAALHGIENHPALSPDEKAQAAAEIYKGASGGDPKRADKLAAQVANYREQQEFISQADKAEADGLPKTAQAKRDQVSELRKEGFDEFGEEEPEFKGGTQNEPAKKQEGQSQGEQAPAEQAPAEQTSNTQNKEPSRAELIANYMTPEEQSAFLNNPDDKVLEKARGRFDEAQANGQRAQFPGLPERATLQEPPTVQAGGAAVPTEREGAGGPEAPAPEASITHEGQQESPRPEMKVSDLTSRGRMAVKVLMSQGVEGPVAVRFADLIHKSLGDVGTEDFRAAVLEHFEKLGGRFPGRDHGVTDPAAYEASGYSPEESATHAANQKKINEASEREVLESNRALAAKLPSDINVTGGTEAGLANPPETAQSKSGESNEPQLPQSAQSPAGTGQESEPGGVGGTQKQGVEPSSNVRPGGEGEHGIATVEGNEQSGADFHAAISGAAASHPYGAAVEVKAPEEYAKPGTKLLLAPDKSAGVAVTPKGDLVSVFKAENSKAKTGELIQKAIKAGAKSLDAYDTNNFLPNLYGKHGFRPVARVAFDASVAGPNWDYAKFGRPDIVLMAYDPANKLGLAKGKYEEIKNQIPLADSYDQAKALQAQAVEKIEKTQSPLPKARAQRNDGGFSEHPVIQAITGDLGGIMSKTTARKKWGTEKFEKNKSLWEDAQTFSDVQHSTQVYKASGQSPDKIAEGLVRKGLLPEGATEKEMWAKLDDISKSSKSIAQQERGQDQQVKEHQKQARSFEAKAFTQEPGEKPINASELAVGDKVQIGTELMSVTAVDPDTFDLTLEDGTKYGIQHIEDGKVLYVEAIEKGEGNEGDFLNPEKPLPKIRANENQGDLLSNQTEDMKLVGEKGIDWEKRQQEQEKAAADKAEAKAIAERAQTNLFEKPGDQFNDIQENFPFADETQKENQNESKNEKQQQGPRSTITGQDNAAERGNEENAQQTNVPGPGKGSRNENPEGTSGSKQGGQSREGGGVQQNRVGEERNSQSVKEQPARPSQAAWVDATYKALVESLPKGTTPESVGLTPDAIERVLGTIHAQGGTDAQNDRARFKIQDDLLANAKKFGNPFVVSREMVNGKLVEKPYSSSLVARTEVGNQRSKEKREVINTEAAQQTIDFAAQRASGYTETWEHVMGKLRETVNPIIDQVVKDLKARGADALAGLNPQQKEELNSLLKRATPEQIAKVLAVKLDEHLGIKTNKEKNLAGFGESRGMKGILGELRDNPAFADIVARNVLPEFRSTLAKTGVEKEDLFDDLLKNGPQPSQSALEALNKIYGQENARDLRIASNLVQNGFTPDMVTGLLPEEARAKIQGVREKYNTDQGSREALRSIAQNSKDPYLRTLAKALLKDFGGSNFKVDLDPTLGIRKGTRGTYFAQGETGTGRMELDPLRSTRDFESTLIHEHIHGLLSGKTNAFLQGEGNEAFSKLSETDRANLTKLEALRVEALAQAPKEIQDIAALGRSEAQARAFRQLLSNENGRMEAEGQKGDNQFRAYYGLLNLHEFATETLTNRQFQDWAKDLKSSTPENGKAPVGALANLWNRIKDTLRSLIVGKPIPKDSLLARALDKSIDLVASGRMEDQQAIGEFKNLSANPGAEGGDLKTDARDQSQYFKEHAGDHGFKDVNEWVKKDPESFIEEAKDWRDHHPLGYAEVDENLTGEEPSDYSPVNETLKDSQGLLDRADRERQKILGPEDNRKSLSLSDLIKTYGDAQGDHVPTQGEYSNLLKAAGGLTDAQIKAVSKSLFATHSYHYDLRAEEENAARVQENFQAQKTDSTGWYGAKVNQLAKDLGMESATMGNLGAIPGSKEAANVLAGWKDTVVKAGKLADSISRYFKADNLRKKIPQLFDSTDNQAGYLARQLGNRVRLNQHSGGDLADAATTFVLQSNGDKAAMIAQLNAIKGKGYDKEISYAIRNYDKLQDSARVALAATNGVYRAQINAGIDLAYHEAYVRGVYDEHDPAQNKVIFDKTNGSEGGLGSDPKKSKVFNNYAEAIAAGFHPRDLRLSKLTESTVLAGMKRVNRILWLDNLGKLKMYDGNPLMVEPLAVPSRNSLGSPSTTAAAPSGYTLVRVTNGTFRAVHEEMAPLISKLTSESQFPAIISKTSSSIKHNMLAYDFFHGSRFGQMQMGFEGLAKPSYHKGLALLEYSDKDLALAVKSGEVKPKDAKWAMLNRPLVEGGIKAGLNVGKISDALFNEVSPMMPYAKATNNFIFEKLSRGVITQSYVYALERNARIRPDLNLDQLHLYTAREVNTYYRNLGSQGIFKSKTWQDAARAFGFAPQWFEGMLRSEARGYGQAAKALLPYSETKTISTPSGDKTVKDWHWNPTRGGNIAKGMSTGLISYLAINQLINYMFRGHSTFENPEVGHKLDAYIPDAIEGGPGFFLSPMSVFAENTHDVVKNMERGMKPLDVPKTILKGKMAPLLHGYRDIVLGYDYYGRPLEGMDRFKQGLVDVAPLPLVAKAMLFKSNSYKGAAQRQALGWLGLKVVTAGSKVNNIHALADDWMRENHVEKPVFMGTSDYSNLRKALADGKLDEAQGALDALKGKHGYEQVVRNMVAYSTKPFTGNAVSESKFTKTLDRDQMEIYNSARRETQEILKRFLTLKRND